MAADVPHAELRTARRRRRVLTGLTVLALSGCPEPEPAVPVAPPVEVSREPPALPTLSEGWQVESGGDLHQPSSPPSPPSSSGPGAPFAPREGFGQCMRSRMCELEGFCSPGGPGGLCIAASSDDCKPSDACLGGRCTAFEGRCIAATDTDCRDSWACKGYGRCFHDGDEACMARVVDDCLASTRCQREGECSLRAGECVKP